MSLTELHIPVAGSKISALDKLVPWKLPPVINTFPVDSKLAVCWERGVIMLFVELHIPDVASYSSVMAVVLPPAVTPPVTSTRASGNRVAVCNRRGMVILPVGAQAPDGEAVTGCGITTIIKSMMSIRENLCFMGYLLLICKHSYCCTPTIIDTRA